MSEPAPDPTPLPGDPPVTEAEEEMWRALDALVHGCIAVQVATFRLLAAMAEPPRHPFGPAPKPRDDLAVHARQHHQGRAP